MTSLLLALLVAAAAPAEDTLTVDGELHGSFSQSDLKALGAQNVSWTSHGQKHHGTGVALDKVLVKAGFTPGVMGGDVAPKDKRKGFKLAVRATAKDGFEAIFSCAELTPGMGPTKAYVVWELDGKPLGDKDAPFRLVVPTDKEPSRSMYQLVKLDVVDLRKQ